MTTKQIAQAVGKDERTVARWVSVVSDKMSEVSDKVSKAKATSKPADYTLAEACQIIEQGMGLEVAATFRTNAAIAESLSRQAAQPVPRLSGALVRELRLSYPQSELVARLDYLIGYKSDGNPGPAPKQISGRPSGIGPISKQAYAVEMKVRAAEAAKAHQKRLTPELGL